MYFRTVKKLFKMSRPLFWIYLAGPFLVGYAFAINSFLDYFNWFFWYSLFFFLVPVNIFLYGVNDFFDRDTDALNVKKGNKEYRMESTDLRFYKKSILGSFLFSIPLFTMLDLFPRMLLMVFFLLAFFYSTPPLRFKARPFLDFLSNGLYVLPGVIYYIQLTSTTPPISLLFATICWTGAMHLYSAIPDIKADATVGLQTTAVVLGYDKSLILCMGLWSIFAYIISGYSPVFMVVWIYPFLVAAVYSKQIAAEKLYWIFPWINLGLGFLLYLYATFS